MVTERVDWEVVGKASLQGKNIGPRRELVYERQEEPNN